METLRICVEKTLSQEDKEIVKEEFSNLEQGTIPGVEITTHGTIKYKTEPEVPRSFPRVVKDTPVLIEESYDGDISLLNEKLKQYVRDGIIILNDPNKSLKDSLIDREFTVNKMTVSFNPPGNVKWTPIQSLKNMRDNKGNLIPLDPLEYKIRTLSHQEAVKTVIRERFMPIVNLDFEFLDEVESNTNNNNSSQGVLRVGFQEDKGCWALLGLDHFFSTDEVTLNFAWLDVGTIIHELCHVLGLIHEHQLPRGNKIDWDLPKVYQWAEQTQGWDKDTTYKNIVERYDKKQINGTAFDPTSIMLYFFPAELTRDNKGTTQNLRFAPNDIRVLMVGYPGKKIDYKKFYKQIYGVDVPEPTPVYVKIILWIFAVFLVGGIIWLLIFLFRKKNKRRKS